MDYKYDVRDIAGHIIDFAVSINNPISHLKLQKILYLVQGYFLAENRIRLYNQDIEMWKLGPVVNDVYHLYKQNGSRAIKEVPSEITFDVETENFVFKKNQKTLEQSDAIFVQEIFKKYIKFSSSKLVDLTHEHKPWKQRKGEILRGEKGITYNDQELIDCFNELIISEEAKNAH